MTLGSLQVNRTEDYSDVTILTSPPTHTHTPLGACRCRHVTCTIQEQVTVSVHELSVDCSLGLIGGGGVGGVSVAATPPSWCASEKRRDHWGGERDHAEEESGD